MLACLLTLSLAVISPLRPSTPPGTVITFTARAVCNDQTIVSSACAVVANPLFAGRCFYHVGVPDARAAGVRVRWVERAYGAVSVRDGILTNDGRVLDKGTLRSVDQVWPKPGRTIKELFR